MSYYAHILLTSDLSEESNLLCERALSLATAMKANLSIIHVVEHTPVAYGNSEFSIPLDVNIEESLEKNAKGVLEKQGQKLGIPKEQQYVIIGSRKQEIVKLATQKGVDLTIVGAHDSHGLGLFLGSTADALVHALPCDVLCIKVDYE